MINWDLLTLKNLAIVALMGIVAYFIFNKFSKKGAE